MASSVSIPVSAFTLHAYAPQIGARTPYAFGGSVARITAEEDGQDYYVHAFCAAANEYHNGESPDESISGVFHVARPPGLSTNTLLVGGGGGGAPAELYDEWTYHTFPGAGGTVLDRAYDLPYGGHGVSVAAKGIYDPNWVIGEGDGGDTALLHPQYSWRDDTEGGGHGWSPSNDTYDEDYGDYENPTDVWHAHYAAAGGGGDAVFPNGGPGYDASARYGTTWGENGIFAAGGSPSYAGEDTEHYPNPAVRQVGRGPNTGCGFCAIGTDGYTIDGGDPPADGIVLIRYRVDQPASLASTPYATGGFIVANPESPRYQHYFVEVGDFEVTNPDGLSVYWFLNGESRGRWYYEQGTHTLQVASGDRLRIEYNDPEPDPVAVAGSPFASGGDIYRIQRGGQWYYVHAFTAGTADFQSLLSSNDLAVDVLVVGGGCSTCDFDGAAGGDHEYFWQGGSGGDVEQVTRTVAPGESIATTVGVGGGALFTDGGQSAFGSLTVDGGYHPYPQCFDFTKSGNDKYAGGYDFDGVVYTAGAGAGGQAELIPTQDPDDAGVSRSPYVPGPGIDAYETFGGGFGDHGYFGGGGGSGIAGGSDGLGVGAPNCGGGYSAIGATWEDWTLGTPASDGIVLVRYREPTVSIPRAPYWLQSLRPNIRLDFTQSAEAPVSDYLLRSLLPTVEVGHFGYSDAPLYVVDEAYAHTITPVIESLFLDATSNVSAIYRAFEHLIAQARGVAGTVNQVCVSDQTRLSVQSDIIRGAALRALDEALTGDSVDSSKIAWALRVIDDYLYSDDVDSSKTTWSLTAADAAALAAFSLGALSYTLAAHDVFLSSEMVEVRLLFSRLVFDDVSLVEHYTDGYMVTVSRFLDAQDQLSGGSEATYTRSVMGYVASTLGVNATIRARFFLFVDAADSAMFSDALRAFTEATRSAQDAFHFLGSIGLDEDDYVIWALNTATLAASRYRGLMFDNVVSHQGRTFGVMPSGVYELVGDTDDGAPIPAHIRTGMLDLGSAVRKSIRRAYLYVKSDTTLYLKVAADLQGQRSQTWYELTLTPGDPLQYRRVDLGRGAKGTRWSFEVSNTQGGQLDVRGLDVYPVLLSRRQK